MTRKKPKWQEESEYRVSEAMVESTIRRNMGEVELPVSAGIGASLYTALKHRRSERSYSSKPMPLQELATVCWVSSGASEKIGKIDLRTAPSAGAAFPLELNLIVNNVMDIEPGLYRYRPSRHILELLALRDMSEDAAAAMADQGFIARSALVLVWSAKIELIESRYQERAFRYIYLEAGHQCQNALLVAYSLDLSACPIGAFYDQEVANLIGIDNDEEIPIYAASFGNPN